LKEFRIISNNIDSNKPIGFFDSGVGGLTVFEKLKNLLPNEDYLYFGDTKNMPYGEKNEQELLSIADNIFKFFEKQNVKAVVMACNTTSAVVYEKLKDNYNYNFKIYPIIQSVAGIFANLPIKKIGVFATRATVSSGIYKKEIQKINPDMEVIEIACPQWVKIVEESRENCPESIGQIKEKMREMLKHSPDKIVLGCTHYPYLTDILINYSPAETFIDPAISFAQYVKSDLAKNNLINCQSAGSEKFYVSSSPENFQKAATVFYKIKKLPELINL